MLVATVQRASGSSSDDTLPGYRQVGIGRIMEWMFRQRMWIAPRGRLERRQYATTITPCGRHCDVHVATVPLCRPLFLPGAHLTHHKNSRLVNSCAISRALDRNSREVAWIQAHSVYAYLEGFSNKFIHAKNLLASTSKSDV
jgi:hypothetical protein